MEHRLRTFMSPVFFRSPANPCKDPHHPVRAVEPKLVEFRTHPDMPQLCLFDELLGGGFAIPDSIIGDVTANQTKTQTQGLFLLLSGPPGSGKSTLALELCYRLATNPNPGIGAIGDRGVSSIYVSSESSAPDLVEQAQSLGWKTDDVIAPWTSKRNPDKAHVTIYGRDHELFTQKLANAKAENCRDYFSLIHENWRREMSRDAPYRPSLIVFDSLNVLPATWPIPKVRNAILETCLRGPIMMIAILDAGPALEADKVRDEWEYFADLSIYLGYEKREDYLVRSLQIVKARYQDHADGEHRLKLNPKPDEETGGHPMSPFIREGGIFVFPSVHRHLSVARSAGTNQDNNPATPENDDPNDNNPTESENDGDNQTYSKEKCCCTTKPDGYIPTPFINLNDIIEQQGYPRGYSTAIVGSRGGMKSHLAYYSLLRYLRDNPEERALIVSLRDAEEAALNTLAQIQANQRDDNRQPLDKDLTDPNKAKAYIKTQYMSKDRLEILFFWPGYISPDEFFHLVGLAVDRAPEDRNRVSLIVVNGLEQLNARFPLCAEEKMFVSGLVTLLCAKKATSIVVSGGDVSAPPERGGVPAGLLQMADLIIESSFRLLPKASVWSPDVWPAKEKWSNVVTAKQPPYTAQAQQEEPHVVYQVVRGPGARECRKRALFYMGRTEDPEPMKPGSVYVRPLPDDFPYGKTMNDHR